eukprot:361702-Chlamydomonas_euryale.AAC.3
MSVPATQPSHMSHPGTAPHQVVVPSSFFVSSTFQGIIWYVMPSMLIIVNDIFAYIFGITLGRTPLIKLSPKKTWEGFLGGFVCAAVAAFYGSRVSGGRRGVA